MTKNNPLRTVAECGIGWIDPKLLQNAIRVETLKIDCGKNKACFLFRSGCDCPVAGIYSFWKIQNQWQIMGKALHSGGTVCVLALRSVLSLSMLVLAQPAQFWVVPCCLSMTYFGSKNTSESYSNAVKNAPPRSRGPFERTSLYLDALRAGLLQQFDGARVCCLLAAAVVPGQVAASGPTRQLVAQLLSRHRVLQGGTAKTEAGRRWEEGERKKERNRKRWAERTMMSSLFKGFVYTLSMNWATGTPIKKKKQTQKPLRNK